MSTDHISANRIDTAAFREQINGYYISTFMEMCITEYDEKDGTDRLALCDAINRGAEAENILSSQENLTRETREKLQRDIVSGNEAKETLFKIMLVIAIHHMFCRYQGNYHEVDEMLQEIMITLYEQIQKPSCTYQRIYSFCYRGVEALIEKKTKSVHQDDNEITLPLETVSKTIPVNPEDIANPETYIDHTELQDKLIYLLSTLTPREEMALRMVFGIEAGHEFTKEEEAVFIKVQAKTNLVYIAELFGVSRERARQIVAKALRKLRHPSRYWELRDYVCGIYPPNGWQTPHPPCPLMYKLSSSKYDMQENIRRRNSHHAELAALLDEKELSRSPHEVYWVQIAVMQFFDGLRTPQHRAVINEFAAKCLEIELEYFEKMKLFCVGEEERSFVLQENMRSYENYKGSNELSLLEKSLRRGTYKQAPKPISSFIVSPGMRPNEILYSQQYEYYLPDEK